jgi:hypothetical protein
MAVIARIIFLALLQTAIAKIDRRTVVQSFNPQRFQSSNSTPLQVGNGNFAFGADISGLQTFQSFNTLSSWGWHNASLPTTPGQTSPSDFTGLDWWTHGRLVNYDQPNPEESDISNWLIANPQRINLGRIGLWFDGSNVTEAALVNKYQELDLYSGTLCSTFQYNGSEVRVITRPDSQSDSIGIEVDSTLILTGRLGIFFDYPYSDVNKFDAPFVGNWSAVSKHTTTLNGKQGQAMIQHSMDATIYYTTIMWEGKAMINGPLPDSHKYVLQPTGSSNFKVSINYAATPQSPPSLEIIEKNTQNWWSNYWETGSFVDLTQNKNQQAIELQRRIILSQYLLAVNEAGNDPPQESGLVNNGWYGKFHLEMYWWHCGHWATWSKWPLLYRSLSIYKRFLPSSIQRAKEQGYSGARLGKMSDPTGRSAPGEINSLLIWQQPHPIYFAEMEYRAFPTLDTLSKWDYILTQIADFMASYAYWNTSTKVYDLGPPMYPVSENTNPNTTVNPTFELAYWRFGLEIASKWKQRQGQSIPTTWTHVVRNLAPLPTVNNTYPIYEGIPNMWTDPVTVTDHPAMAGIYGLLPPTAAVNLTIVNNTAQKIYSAWDFANLYGWDFPLLAMNAARLGDAEKAIALLLDQNFQFDDVGMPVGGTRVPTPYFPASGSLLLAVGMMAGGWDGGPDDIGSRWPRGWNVLAEGFAKAM